MKKLITLILCLGVSLSFATPTHVISPEIQVNMTPEQALQKLISGNQRYMEQNQRQHNQKAVLKKITRGQHPFAIIFNCVDSRSIPELLFDQTLGNIFVARVAGNVADTNILGSMEFTTKLAGAKLIVVMGHTACGAISGACSNAKLGNLTHLLQQIQPAVDIVKKQEGKEFGCGNPHTIDAIAKQNVLDQMQYIMQNSSVIANLVKEKKVMIVGAMHNLSDGKVTFFNMDGKAVQ